MLKNKKTLLALSIILQYILISILSKFPGFVETYYSNGIYPFISKVLRYGLGWVPFSIGDLLYALAGIYIVRWFFKNRKRLRRDTKKWFIDVFSGLALVYFMFHILWGFNYYRLPLHESLNLGHDYTTDELIAVTEKLIKKSNEYHLKITKNDTLRVDAPYSKSKVFELTESGYHNLKKEFPNLAYTPRSIKKSLFSYPLTYMGFSGYLNPFTNEAQVGAMIPVYKIFTTSSHEIAHQLGYAAENEANFMGCLAAINSDDIYFKYAGYTFGLRYCLNEIHNRDECLYEDLVADVNTGILKNYKEVRDFWEVHHNPIEPIFKWLYSNFLKANKQSKGLKSYSYVVALLVNYYGVDNK